MLTTLALVALAPVMVEPVDFAHNFQKGQKLTYEFSAVGDQGGQDVEAKGDIVIEIIKVNEDGSAEANFSCAAMSLDGMEIPLPSLAYDLRKIGIIADPMMGDESAIYAIASIGLSLPGKSLEEGGEFEHDFKSPAASYKAKGSFLGWKELKGSKYAYLESEGSLSPTDDTPGDIVQKTYYDPATKMVVFSTMDVELGSGGFYIEIALKK